MLSRVARSIQSQFDLNGLLHRLDAWSSGSGPLYRGLANALRTAITRGDMSVGELLPPERVLARYLKISRSTVVAAYELLADEHLLERRQGSGTRVCAAPSRTSLGIAGTLNRNVLFRRIIDRPGGTVDLTGAYLLEPGGLPRELIEDVASETAGLAETSGYSPLGYEPLREAIAAHLSERGVPTAPDQVMVTSGAQQGIWMTGWLFLQRGDTVLTENPTYPGALDAFTAVGARLVGVRTRRNGVDIASLAERLAAVAPRLVYLIPTYQNPVGGVISPQDRRRLADLVQHHQVPLLEDDSLSGLAIVGDAPPPVAAFAPSAPILTAGSLSKLFWAGLRVGWIRGPEPIIAQLARLKAVADLGGALPSQVIASRLLSRYDEFRRSRRPVIAQRLDLVTGLLAEMLPEWSWDRPLGGLCLWVRLPYGSATEFAQVALRTGVSIVAGSVASTDATFDDHLRLPFGHRPEVLEEGIRRLARAWQIYARSDEPREQRMAIIV
jgi:DNA-binding transcriptional MocR family regulator